MSQAKTTDIKQYRDLLEPLTEEFEDVVVEEPVVETQPEVSTTDTADTTFTELNPSLEHDRYFLQWLKSSNQSLLISSYKTNYVFNIGSATLLKPEVRDQLSFWMTSVARPMGMCVSGNDIYIGTMTKLMKYTRFPQAKTDEGVDDDGVKFKRSDFDGYYVPRQMNVVGDIDIHDIVVDKNKEVYFVSALFCSVLKKSETHSFQVFWRPPWISKSAAEDRCHLNGLCAVNGVPRYVTSVARTNVRGAWRNGRVGGGVVWDMVENKLVCANLSMPHSPRWHNGKLWLLNSGCGEFGFIDFKKIAKTSEGEVYHPFIAKCFVPAYLRGLCFVGNDFAVIGKSQDRYEKTFQGLPLGEKLLKNKIESSCGICVIDLNRFDIVHELTLNKPITEIYDVVSLPNVTRPMLEVDQVSVVSQLFDFVDNTSEMKPKK